MKLNFKPSDMSFWSDNISFFKKKKKTASPKKKHWECDTFYEIFWVRGEVSQRSNNAFLSIKNLVMWTHCNQHSRFPGRHIKANYPKLLLSLNLYIQDFFIFWQWLISLWAENGKPRAILSGLFKQPLQRGAILILHYWYGKKMWVNVIVTRKETATDIFGHECECRISALRFDV